LKVLVAGHSVNHPRQRMMWQWIAEQGHQVTVCGPQRWGDEEYKRFRSGNFTMLPQPIASFRHAFHFTMPLLLDVIEQFQPDVLVCFEEPPSVFAYQCSCLAEMFGLPFVVFTWENLEKIHLPLYSNIERHVLSRAEIVVAGNREAARIMRLKNHVNVAVLPQSGLNGEMFKPLPTIKVAKRRKKRVLYVGRLVPEKDIEGILVAWDRVIKRELSDVELMFVGGRGEEEKKIRAHPDFGKTVLLQPWVKYDQLPSIYNEADVVVYPSLDTKEWSEQWGAVCGEALLCEVPVVANLSGALPEYWKCEDTFFVAPGDREALGWKVVEVLKANRLAKAGREHVLKTCSIPVIGERYIKLLRRLV